MSDSPGLERLTDKHKECLRLVLQGYGAKEIAREIGVTDHAVEARLKRAMMLLGVNSRFEAARILAAHEGTYQPLVYQPPELSEPQKTGTFPVSPDFGDFGEQGAAEPHALREERSAFDADVLDRPGLPLPVPTKGRRWNDLSLAQRVGWIIALTAALAVGAGTLMNALITITQVARAFAP